MIVDSLKKSILRQAFQGNLSIRKKSDSNIKETIKNILKIKEEKIKNKIYKETTKGKEISDNDKQYQIPSTWEWVRLIDLCSVITCGYASHLNMYQMVCLFCQLKMLNHLNLNLMIIN